jgi:hypothetical protein
MLVGEAVPIEQTANEMVRRGLIEITATALGGALTTMMSATRRSRPGPQRP